MTGLDGHPPPTLAPYGCMCASRCGELEFRVLFCPAMSAAIAALVVVSPALYTSGAPLNNEGGLRARERQHSVQQRLEHEARAHDREPDEADGLCTYYFMLR